MDANHPTRVAAVLLGAGLFAVQAGVPAMAIEEPAYRTVQQDGDFELRDYEPSIVAEVTVTGDQKSAGNRGFRLLAGYIFGGNRAQREIAMTAPVAQQPVSQKIAMTAPVSQTAQGEAWLVRFTMPREWTLQTLPVPDDPAVRLVELPASRVAVRRFSGLARPDDVAERSAELLEWTQARGLRAVGPVTLAQYNPPWTPWFMRRNEVLVPVQR